MSTDLDQEGGVRAKWFGFPEVGDIFEGDFLNADKRQARDYDTDEPKTWDDGTPVDEFILTFQTVTRDTPDDDGRRTLYAEKHKALFKSMGAALTAAGLKWADAPHLKIKRTADSEPTILRNNKKGKPAKQFKAVATRSVSATTAALDDNLIEEDPF